MQPLSPDRSLASAGDLATCRQMLAGGSKTFFLASFFLPWRVRDPAIALYAFCRQADDAVDCADNRGAIEALLQRLDDIYDGRPANAPADRAFADAVAQFHIPKAIPLALIEGFLWDVEGRHYRTIADVEAYAARVAGTVGAMMALVMGVRDPATLARACDLGVAMQLTNIARDVGDDARMGRLYLPRDWMVESGLDPDAFIATPTCSPRLQRVVQRLLDRAEEFYASADIGIEALPAACRPSIRAARRLYAEIGRVVEANTCDSVSQRAVVAAQRKMTLAAQSFSATASLVARPPVLQGAEFLIEAAARLSEARRQSEWALPDRLVWAANVLSRPPRPSRPTRDSRRTSARAGLRQAPA